MKLSVLDSSPIAAGKTSQDALLDSATLAQAVEQLGYTRFWLTEHHDLNGLASSTPEVLLAWIGSKTSHIRLGTGAILLPHYKPFKVAEIHHTLATLFPDRIDIGLGRAPGGSAEITNALNDNFLQAVYKMPDLVQELLAYIDQTVTHIQASPVPSTPPSTWLLGTSKKSAKLAAEMGMSYAFGQWMSDTDGAEAITLYDEQFTPRTEGSHAESMITIAALCAETNKKAMLLAKSLFLWQQQVNNGRGDDGIPSIQVARQYTFETDEQTKFEEYVQKMIVGEPSVVAKKIAELPTEEVMIHSPAHDVNDRIHSYKLIADAMNDLSLPRLN
ncbi:luciferase [Bacillaceae bacterium JMAK1]|nr:luciferase [Bacillaceae bacterium JMAK1]